MPIPPAVVAVAATLDLDRLAADVAAFSGSPAVIDPRLRLPSCAAPAIEWAGPAHAAVAVTCAAPAWRIYVPTRAAAAVPLIRRGDAVTVSAAGDGFRVSIDGVAENDAGIGARVRVRANASGAHLAGLVAADGTVTLPGYSAAPGGR